MNQKPNHLPHGLYGCLPTNAGVAISVLATPASESDNPPEFWLAGSGPLVDVASQGSLTLVAIGQPEMAGQNVSAEDLLKQVAADEAALNGVTGTFQLLVHDGDSGRIQVLTDVFGRFPVFYRRTGRGLEISASPEKIAASAKVTADALMHFFFFHMLPSPLSAFDGVHKLPNNSLLDICGDVVRVVGKGYAKPSDCPRPKAADIQPALRAAVARTTRRSGHQRVAAFLSGGLDSTAVVGMLAGQRDTEITAYSIGFDVPGYDELEFAQAAADHYGVPLKTHKLTADDLIADIDLICKGLAQPFGNSSIVPTFHCARMAAEDGHDVIFAGDGGDELFAGNTRYREQLLFQAWQVLPKVLRTDLLEPLVMQGIGNLPGLGKLQRYVQFAGEHVADRLSRYNFLEQFPLDDMFSPSFRQRVASNRPKQLYRSAFDELPDDDFINQMLFADWRFTLADNDLMKVGQATHIAGIEVEFPFLDSGLVTMATAMPGSTKMPWGRLRGCFRDAMRDFLPITTIKKQKHGFGMPFGPWLQESKALRDLVSGTLEDFSSRQVLKPAFIDSLQKDLLGEHAAYFGEMIWLVFLLERWLVAHDCSLDVIVQCRS